MPWTYAAAAVGTYLGSRQAGKGARAGARTEAEARMEALDYQREVEALPLELRNQFLPQLADYYSGGEGQAALVEDVRQSPMYEEMVRSGQEGVLSKAGAMGLTRSGNVAQDLSLTNQQVLQGLVQQRLGGMSSLAQLPLRTGEIAAGMSGIGQTLGAGQIASERARQQGYQGMFQAIGQGLSQYGGG